ncbi:hypothetical protein HJC23_008306 [Cyclotella cryptica]|uniref:Methylmalonic aciduria and homocystinuria type D protein n=1 Tax=Cyclotella cryptica TaxID=29204 RepID=A0ABD3Q577_9STRA|eukprot:CCRYP_008582-RA/>CCRYP_008582-RA protein AED:0.34 eAED:0.34 QI:238/1/1/1/0.66/0.5/4/957/221
MTEETLNSVAGTGGTSATTTTASTILPPRLVRSISSMEDELECSLHYLPKPLMREFGHVFNDEYLRFNDDDEDATMAAGGNNDNESSSGLRLLAIPTNQRAREDLVAVGDQIEEEKDRLLNVFLDFGKYICQALRSKGYWADYIDPCSGLPMISLNCNKVYSEVDGMECLLNYKAYNAGFCKILMHPKWGSAVYPATIFAHAPPEVVRNLIESLPLGSESK